MAVQVQVAKALQLADVGNATSMDWADGMRSAIAANPDLIEPVDLTDLELEGRVAALETGDGSLSIIDFGGGPDKEPGVNVAALHDAVAVSGGYRPIRIPRVGFDDSDGGQYLFDQPLDMREVDGLVLTGSGGNPYRFGTRMLLVGGGDFSFIDLRGARGATVESVAVAHWSETGDPNFEGTLIDLSGGVTGREARRCSVVDVSVGGVTAPTGTGIAMDRCHSHSLSQVAVNSNRVGVAGADPDGGWSNAHKLDRVSFHTNMDTAILDGGTAWGVSNTVFNGWEYGEYDVNPSLRFSDWSVGADAMSFTNIWYGDVGDGVGFELVGKGFVFSGFMSCHALDGGQHTAIKAVGPVSGLDLGGVAWQGRPPGKAVDFNGQSVTGFTPGHFGPVGDWWTNVDPWSGVPKGWN